MSEGEKHGVYAVRREPDTGFVVIVVDGTVDAEDAVWLMAKLAEYRERDPNKPQLILTDFRKATGFTKEGRKAMSSSWKVAEARVDICTASFGASLVVRTITNLLHQASRLFIRMNLQTIMVATEEEARAWLSEQAAAKRQNKAQA